METSALVFGAEVVVDVVVVDVVVDVVVEVVVAEVAVVEVGVMVGVFVGAVVVVSLSVVSSLWSLPSISSLDEQPANRPTVVVALASRNFRRLPFTTRHF